MIGTPQGAESSTGRNARPQPSLAREALVAWREVNGVGYLFDLARNPGLAAQAETELAPVRTEAETSDKPAGRFP